MPVVGHYKCLHWLRIHECVTALVFKVIHGCAASYLGLFSNVADQAGRPPALVLSSSCLLFVGQLSVADLSWFSAHRHEIVCHRMSHRRLHSSCSGLYLDLDLVPPVLSRTLGDELSPPGTIVGTGSISRVTPVKAKYVRVFFQCVVPCPPWSFSLPSPATHIFTKSFPDAVIH